MRNLGSTWNTLIARDTTVLQSKLTINGTDYTAITTPIVNHSLLQSEELAVGNCIAASMKVTIMTTNTIPKSATVVLKCRLVDGNTSTSWYEFGTFYVSKREKDDDLVSIECYDAMLKGNQVYGGSESALNWPKPMQSVLNTIASRMGLSIDSRTSIRSDSTNYKCEYPGDMTLLEILGHIGACNGGNWIITPENKLRLVPLTGSGSTVNVTAVFSQITTASSYTVSGVKLVLDEDHVYSAGNTSGFVLIVNPCPYANQTIANNLYNTLNGLTYQPFVAAGCIYNPAAELGDRVTVGSVTSTLFEENRSYDLDFRSDIGAPGKDELEDEYPYPSEILRLQNSVVELAENAEVLSSRITQTQTSIETEVTRATGAESSLSTRITQTEGSISSEVTRATGAESSLSTRITQNATAISSKVTAGDVESIIEQKAGSIRLKAAQISWESTYSSMTADGKLTCAGATVKGSVYSEGPLSGTQGKLWVRMLFGKIEGGYVEGNTEDKAGEIYFSTTNNNHIGIKSDQLHLDADEIYVKRTGVFPLEGGGTTTGTSLVKGFTGVRRFITSITDNGDGSISWTWQDYEFVGGLMLEYYYGSS